MKQHTIIESPADDGYTGIDNGTKVCYFLKVIKSTDFSGAMAKISMPLCLVFVRWS